VCENKKKGKKITEKKGFASCLVERVDERRTNSNCDVKYASTLALGAVRKNHVTNQNREWQRKD